MSDRTSMFLEELKPVVQVGLKQPIAFLGGLASGLFRLDPGQDPLKTWLDQQGRPCADRRSASGAGSSDRPQTITID